MSYLINDARVLPINLFWTLSLLSHGREQTRQPVIVTTPISAHNILCQAAGAASVGRVCVSVSNAWLRSRIASPGTPSAPCLRAAPDPQTGSWRARSRSDGVPDPARDRRPSSKGEFRTQRHRGRTPCDDAGRDASDGGKGQRQGVDSYLRSPGRGGGRPGRLTHVVASPRSGPRRTRDGLAVPVGMSKRLAARTPQRLARFHAKAAEMVVKPVGAMMPVSGVGTE